MKTRRLIRNALLPVAPDTAWRFFSDPRNLPRITPPGIRFRVLTRGLPNAIHEGLEISYSVAPLWGVSLPWTSRITRVDAGCRFVDEQIRGPFALWRHEHVFARAEGGTLMEDILEYRLPLGWLGEAAHSLVVGKKLNHIFDYREHSIESIFSDNKPKQA